MNKPVFENYTRGVHQIEYMQAVAAYQKDLERYCDFMSEMHIRKDLQYSNLLDQVRDLQEDITKREEENAALNEEQERMERHLGEFEATFFAYAPASVKQKWLDANEENQIPMIVEQYKHGRNVVTVIAYCEDKEILKSFEEKVLQLDNGLEFGDG